MNPDIEWIQKRIQELEKRVAEAQTAQAVNYLTGRIKRFEKLMVDRNYAEGTR